jgi:hypothetical protein
MLVLKVTKINITFEWTIKKITWVCNRVRLGVKFVCTVYSASGPMVSVVGDDRSGDPLHFEYIWSFIHIFPISLTFGRQCGYHTNTGRLQVPTRATRQTFRVARFFSPMAPSWDGERAGPLPNMLFGAKHGGRHHQWCVSTLPSSRRQILRCSWTRIEDFDRDTRTDGLIYTAANLTHSRPSFLGFLRQSKTSL